MSHELIMPNPGKVQSMLDDAEAAIKKIKGTVETTSMIGKMDLKIGGLDKSFGLLEQLMPALDGVIKTFVDTKEAIRDNVARFEADNENITF